MARKKKVEEEQPVTAEVVETKKKSSKKAPKTKMSAQKESIQETGVQFSYLQPIITQYFIDNKSEIWLLFLIAHSKR